MPLEPLGTNSKYHKAVVLFRSYQILIQLTTTRNGIQTHET